MTKSKGLGWGLGSKAPAPRAEAAPSGKRAGTVSVRPGQGGAQSSKGQARVVLASAFLRASSSRVLATTLPLSGPGSTVPAPRLTAPERPFPRLLCRVWDREAGRGRGEELVQEGGGQCDGVGRCGQARRCTFRGEETGEGAGRPRWVLVLGSPRLQVGVGSVGVVRRGPGTPRCSASWCSGSREGGRRYTVLVQSSQDPPSRPHPRLHHAQRRSR